MADILKLLAIFTIFACFLNSGDAQCSLSDIVVTQRPTGKLVSGQPEYEVTITTTCPCIEHSVKLDINGFQTVEPIDSSILNKDGYLNNMMPLPGLGLKFKYASRAMFPFRPVYSEINCSPPV